MRGSESRKKRETHTPINLNTLRQINTGEHDVLQCPRICTLALCCKCNADLREEPLYCGGRRGAAEILPRHHSHIWELICLFLPPLGDVTLRLHLDLWQRQVGRQLEKVIEKALIGLVACEKERHTAENIAKWTNDALKAIGLTKEGILEQYPQ